jgi:superfamily II DNA or RNA helicase
VKKRKILSEEIIDCCYEYVISSDNKVLDRAEFILCDELHKYKSDVTSEIIKETVNAKYKWGLTGTMPEDEGDQLELIGMFGYPKRYIRAKELIERGLATPVKINSIFLNYNQEDKNIFNNIPRGNWQKQLGFIKEHERRNNFIENLAIKVKETGNTLVLASHVEHMKILFTNIMKKMYPAVEVQNKDITGKKSFEFQQKYGVYFLNGEDDAITRELTRKILDRQRYEITLNNDNILVMFHNDKVQLSDGSEKLIQDLAEEDEISDDFLKKIEKTNIR